MANQETKADPWDVGFQQPQKASQDEVERWQRLRSRLAVMAKQHRWSKSEVSSRSGIPAGTLWQWYDGSYQGVLANQSERVEKWLDAVIEHAAVASRVQAAPAFVSTPTSRKIIDALLYAQTMPEIVVLTTAPGMGKTVTADHYVDLRPHAYKVTMRPYVSSVHGLLQELAIALEVTERSPARLDRSVGEKLKRNGRNTLLIVDEAQNLSVEAVNQLRYFLDVYGCGIALLGNEELYSRFGGKEIKPAYAQLHSRFGLRLKEMQPDGGDIAALVAAWGIEDEDVRRLAAAIGRKPGALRQINKTLQLAGMYAAGDQRAMTAADVRAAIQSRGLEG